MRKYKICGIYKITSPSGKIYIGKAKDIKNRWDHYNILQCEKQPRLYRSLKKHGVKNHTFEIVEECIPEQLNEREIYYIKSFDSFDTPHGLNLKAGGEGGGEWSDESRARASKWQEGRTLTEEHSKNIGKGNKKAWADLSPEDRDKRIASSCLNKKGNKKSDDEKKKLSDIQSEWHKNNKRPPVKEETKKKNSEISKKNWEENREYMISRFKGVKKKESSRINYSNSMKRQRKENPDKYKWTEEGRKKQSERNSGAGNPMYNHHYTDETRRKMSEAQKLAHERIRQEKLTMIF